MEKKPIYLRLQNHVIVKDPIQKFQMFILVAIKSLYFVLSWKFRKVVENIIEI